MTEPASSSSSPDNSGPARCPVSWAIEISKAVVRAADPQDWWPLWRILEAGLDSARERATQSGTAYPWESLDEVAEIAWSDLERTLHHAIVTIPDIPVRRRMVEAAAKADAALHKRAGNGGRPIKATRYGIRVCARPGCGKRFAARSPRHIYCPAPSNCRQLAYAARVRQGKIDGQERSNVTSGAA
jgi:hypothetical protein